MAQWRLGLVLASLLLAAALSLESGVGAAELEALEDVPSYYDTPSLGEDDIGPLVDRLKEVHSGTHSEAATAKHVILNAMHMLRQGKVRTFTELSGSLQLSAEEEGPFLATIRDIHSGEDGDADMAVNKLSRAVGAYKDGKVKSYDDWMYYLDDVKQIGPSDLEMDDLNEQARDVLEAQERLEKHYLSSSAKKAHPNQARIFDKYEHASPAEAEKVKKSMIKRAGTTSQAYEGEQELHKGPSRKEEKIQKTKAKAEKRLEAITKQKELDYKEEMRQIRLHPSVDNINPSAPVMDSDATEEEKVRAVQPTRDNDVGAEEEKDEKEQASKSREARNKKDAARENSAKLSAEKKKKKRAHVTTAAETKAEKQALEKKMEKEEKEMHKKQAELERAHAKAEAKSKAALSSAEKGSKRAAAEAKAEAEAAEASAKQVKEAAEKSATYHTFELTLEGLSAAEVPGSEADIKSSISEQLYVEADAVKLWIKGEPEPGGSSPVPASTAVTSSDNGYGYDTNDDEDDAEYGYGSEEEYGYGDEEDEDDADDDSDAEETDEADEDNADDEDGEDEDGDEEYGYGDEEYGYGDEQDGDEGDDNDDDEKRTGRRLLSRKKKATHTVAEAAAKLLDAEDMLGENAGSSGVILMVKVRGDPELLGPLSNILADVAGFTCKVVNIDAGANAGDIDTSVDYDAAAYAFDEEAFMAKEAAEKAAACEADPSQDVCATYEEFDEEAFMAKEAAEKAELCKIDPEGETCPPTGGYGYGEAEEEEQNPCQFGPESQFALSGDPPGVISLMTIAQCVGMTKDGLSWTSKFMFRPNGIAPEKFLAGLFPGGFEINFVIMVTPIRKMSACIPMVKRKEMSSTLVLKDAKFCVSMDNGAEYEEGDHDTSQSGNGFRDAHGGGRKLLLAHSHDHHQLAHHKQHGHKHHMPRQDLGTAVGTTGLIPTSVMGVKNQATTALKPRMWMEATLEINLGKDKLDFRALLEINPTVIVLGADLKGLWDKPFGIPGLIIGNLRARIGFTGGAPSLLALGGALGFGKDCRSVMIDKVAGGQCVHGHVYIGVSATDINRNYFSAKISKLTLVDIVNWVTLGKMDMAPLANVLGSTGFPEGLLMSYAIQTATLPGGIIVPAGLVMAGVIDILGYRGRVKVAINPIMLDVFMDISVDPIHLGGIMKLQRSKDDTRGPKFLIDVQAYSLKVHVAIEGYVNVLGFGVYTRINVRSTGLEFVVEGPLFLGLFTARVKLLATWGNPSKAQFNFKAHLLPGPLGKTIGHIADLVKDAVMGALKVVTDAYNKMAEIAGKLGISLPKIEKMKTQEVRFYERHRDLGEGRAFWECVRTRCRPDPSDEPGHYGKYADHAISSSASLHKLQDNSASVSSRHSDHDLIELLEEHGLDSADDTGPVSLDAVERIPSTKLKPHMELDEVGTRAEHSSLGEVDSSLDSEDMNLLLQDRTTNGMTMRQRGWFKKAVKTVSSGAERGTKAAERGTKAAAQAAERGAKSAERGTKAAAQAAERGTKAAERAAKAAAQAAERGAKAAERGAKEVAKKAADKAKEVANKAKEKGEKAVQAAERTAKVAAEKAERGVKATERAAKEAAKAAERGVKKAAEVTKKAAEKAAEIGKKAAEKAAELAKKAADKIKEGLMAIFNKLKSVYDKAANAAKGFKQLAQEITNPSQLFSFCGASFEATVSTTALPSAEVQSMILLRGHKSHLKLRVDFGELIKTAKNFFPAIFDALKGLFKALGPRGNDKCDLNLPDITKPTGQFETTEKVPDVLPDPDQVKAQQAPDPPMDVDWTADEETIEDEAQAAEAGMGDAVVQQERANEKEAEEKASMRRAQSTAEAESEQSVKTETKELLEKRAADEKKYGYYGYGGDKDKDGDEDGEDGDDVDGEDEDGDDDDGDDDDGDDDDGDDDDGADNNREDRYLGVANSFSMQEAGAASLGDNAGALP